MYLCTKNHLRKINQKTPLDKQNIPFSIKTFKFRLIELIL